MMGMTTPSTSGTGGAPPGRDFVQCRILAPLPIAFDAGVDTFSRLLAMKGVSRLLLAVAGAHADTLRGQAPRRRRQVAYG